MEVYAAFSAQTDHEIGRVIAAAERVIGRAVPLAFLIATIGVMFVSYGFVRLTRHFNSESQLERFEDVSAGDDDRIAIARRVPGERLPPDARGPGEAGRHLGRVRVHHHHPLPRGEDRHGVGWREQDVQVSNAGRQHDLLPEKARNVRSDDDLVKQAKEAGVESRTKFVRGDIFATDFSDATVVTTFLLPSMNFRLRATFLAMPNSQVESFVSARIVRIARKARTNVSWVNSSARARSLTMSKMKLMTGREYLSKIRRKASVSPWHTRVTRSAEVFIRVPANAPVINSR